MKMFSNNSDFCLDIPIHEILDQKSLYGRKKNFSEKKNITKIFEKKQLFLKSLLRSADGGTFHYIFGIYKKFGGNNPSIIALTNLVSVAT